MKEGIIIEIRNGEVESIHSTVPNIEGFIVNHDYEEGPRVTKIEDPDYLINTSIESHMRNLID